MIIGYCILKMKVGRIYFKPVQLNKKVNFCFKKRMKLLHSYRTLSEIPALIYSCKRLNPALLFCTAPVPAITSPLPEYSTEQTPPVRMLKVYECSKHGKVKIIKENPFRFLQYRLHFWFGKPSVKIGWRLEGNLGK